jgi:hypothetical protein
MKKTITLSTFRKVARAEEQMLRACMPQTSAACPEPIESAISPRVSVRVLSNGVRLVKPLSPLTATLNDFAVAYRAAKAVAHA